MDSASPKQLTLLNAASQWWSDIAAREGRLVASQRFLTALWEFIRDSTPERLRRRYGDADYDWEHRVNTTSAAVSWRDRLLGVFHSPYQPTEPALFHEMLDALQRQAHLDFREFTFIDLGSGKGRSLMLASDYPFRRILGVELLPALHQIAQENLKKYTSEAQKCVALQSICADATSFPFPAEPTVLYLFNPFPESGLKRMLANLELSLRQNPRPVYILYHNPLLEHVLNENASFTKIVGTHQYSLYKSHSVQEPEREAQGRISCVRIRFLGIASAICLTASLSASADSRPNVKTLAAAVDEHYNHLHSLQAEFTELYRGSGMERTETGTLWLKKPGKMCWEYRSPREKLFVSDGKDAWFYVPGDRQARKMAARKLDDIRSPLAFLLGKTKLEKELQALSLAPDIPPLDPENVVLRGVPRVLADRVSEILLEIAPDKRIVRIVLNEVDGSVTEYALSDQREDKPISDSRFQFRPPAGTETIEGDLAP